MTPYQLACTYWKLTPIQWSEPSATTYHGECNFLNWQAGWHLEPYKFEKIVRESASTILNYNWHCIVISRLWRLVFFGPNSALCVWMLRELNNISNLTFFSGAGVGGGGGAMFVYVHAKVRVCAIDPWPNGYKNLICVPEGCSMQYHWVYMTVSEVQI